MPEALANLLEALVHLGGQLLEPVIRPPLMFVHAHGKGVDPAAEPLPLRRIGLARGRQGPGRNDSDEEVAVCISVRRVLLSFSSTYAWKESSARILANLRAAPAEPT